MTTKTISAKSTPAAERRLTAVRDGTFSVLGDCDLRWLVAITVLCGLVLRIVALH